MSRYETSMTQRGASSAISRRAYNALTFGLVTISFLVLWGTYRFAVNGGLAAMLSGAGLIGLIAFFVASIAGIVLMSIGKKNQTLGMSVAGYALFSLTFGVTLALALMRYSVGTLTYAFAITACISGIFLIAGVTFPQFFSRIGGVLCIGLLAVVLVELVAVVFFHADQTIFDYIVIALFCGFLGYDSYRMSNDAPTVPNAIYYASDIYLDIVNILLRVLDILNKD